MEIARRNGFYFKIRSHSARDFALTWLRGNRRTPDIFSRGYRLNVHAISCGMPKSSTRSMI